MPRTVIPTRTSLEHYSKIQCQLVWRNDLYSTNKKGWDSNLIESFTSPNQHTEIFNVKAKFHLNVRLQTVGKKLWVFFLNAESALLIHSCYLIELEGMEELSGISMHSYFTKTRSHKRETSKSRVTLSHNSRALSSFLYTSSV